MPISKWRRRVGIFTRPIDQGTSGSGSHLKQLVQQIIQQNTTFEIWLIHHKRKELEIYSKAREVIVSRNPLKASLQLRGFGFDLLHFSPLTLSSPLWGLDVKRVATIHGDAPHFLPELYRKWRVLHRRIVVPLYARKMDYIFTVSETSRRFIADEYGVDASRIKLTCNAVTDEFKVLPREGIRHEVKVRYGIDKPFVLHISRFSERKNPWVILEGFRVALDMAGEGGNLRLVLCGSGWDNPIVRAFVGERGMSEKVIMAGFVEEKDLVKFLNLAEVFVFPSLYEGYGMPNLEAMACGCPVITSRVFAIPEVVGDAAVLLDDGSDPCELGCKIMNVIRDSDLRTSLISKGLKNVGRFSWEESAKTVLETYGDCLSSRRN